MEPWPPDASIEMAVGLLLGCGPECMVRDSLQCLFFISPHCKISTHNWTWYSHEKKGPCLQTLIFSSGIRCDLVSVRQNKTKREELMLSGGTRDPSSDGSPFHLFLSLVRNWAGSRLGVGGAHSFPQERGTNLLVQIATEKWGKVSEHWTCGYRHKRGIEKSQDLITGRK